ncbi:hypothetical protein SPACI_023420 [Sporomusa acidovorans DSM 3132]|uniref:Uncharacterized protein n=1 Tax=Sporomusa acidovorans (strain ATCC 49682 / DSM 3132 / Mol) TaxID=1123286 RepID=A0ABZ3J320_SPOA4|nr:hypothetical protein SPACI_08700 [Sporomusa acidovorans DSM 3132]SDE97985.1 Ferrous iron transport protein B [Sporomusa acidovorans]
MLWFVFNLMDEARKKQIAIDVPALEKELGVPSWPRLHVKEKD